MTSYKYKTIRIHKYVTNKTDPCKNSYKRNKVRLGKDWPFMFKIVFVSVVFIKNCNYVKEFYKCEK